MQTKNDIIKAQITELDKVISHLERHIHSGSTATYEAYAKLVEAKIKLIRMLDN